MFLSVHYICELLMLVKQLFRSMYWIKKNERIDQLNLLEVYILMNLLKSLINRGLLEIKFIIC